MNEASWLREALGLKHGDTPFPWQEELLTRFRAGDIPSSLDLPTGLGKTSIMAIWLVARACGALLPRRLVYVVDRRAVVDQATTEAERLRNWLENDSDAKKALGLTRPLPISTLRGQFVDNREWQEDPSSPAIIVGTVDMVGSRLLFEGYGVSRKMRPYHAGLLGADTLVALDEAHLVPPFEKLLETIADSAGEFEARDGGAPEIIPRFRLMSLSATGRAAMNGSFGLIDQDLKHPVLKKRLEAKKHLVLLRSRQGEEESGAAAKENKFDLAEKLAQEARELAEKSPSPVRVIIFCDKREVAAATKKSIEKHFGTDKIDAELFVGGRRVFERQLTSTRLQTLGFIAGSDVPREKSAFLFATSAAEVGVDLDADHMVCDLIAWERMVQRLGRVNRRGDGDATVIVVVESAPEPTKNGKAALAKRAAAQGISEKEQNVIAAFETRVRQWTAYQAPFKRLPECDGKFDVSPGALRELKQAAEKDEKLKKVLNDASTPAPLRPALTRPLVEAWSMTSLENHTGRPDIDPWLRGWIENEPPQTNVAWRIHLPVRSGGCEPKRTEIETFFEAAPPHTSELLETETYRVVTWLERRSKSLTKRDERNAVAPIPRNDDIVAFVIAPNGDLVRSLRLHEFASIDSRRRPELENELRRTTLIVDARVGGLKDGLLDEDTSDLPRTADDGQEWLGEHVIRFRVRSLGADEPSIANRDWHERFRFASHVSNEGEAQRWLIIEKWRNDAATEEDRSAARPQLLDEHQSWAEQRARHLAKRLGLALLHEEMLATAARLHDEGKRTRRWQRAFNAATDGVYAKTKGPINNALLDGYRHELGSLLFVERNERLNQFPDDLRDLALHLITAHHGFARPVIGTRGCDDIPPSLLEQRAREIALRFARLQKRWGPWGLAWWETLLRAADQQASRDNEEAEEML